jgi:phenylacetate-coenzyme A ligase PaaK-like adenylate-forming protein
MADQWKPKIFEVSSDNFDSLALEIFRFQYRNNPLYRNYSDALHIDPDRVKKITGIPFLPVRFFKSHPVATTTFSPGAIFESSGTTGSNTSRHLVKDILLYEESFLRGFEFFYGPVSDYVILGLLPSYLERKNASLVYMVDKLIQLSQHPHSGFYLDDFEKLAAILKLMEKEKQKTLLIGVTFALLDFAAAFSFPLKHTIVMETGGMKGRREEMVREEVHAILQRAFQLDTVHSEYGMTELLSQAYSSGKGIFHSPPWMKVLVRDEEDPLIIQNCGSAGFAGGTINVIDLANIYSCSFIATDDAGKLYSDGGFEVLGRIDNSDIRGCSLLYQAGRY